MDHSIAYSCMIEMFHYHNTGLDSAKELFLALKTGGDVREVKYVGTVSR